MVSTVIVDIELEYKVETFFMFRDRTRSDSVTAENDGSCATKEKNLQEEKHPLIRS